jgi:hypothetical protein
MIIDLISVPFLPCKLGLTRYFLPDFCLPRRGHKGGGAFLGDILCGWLVLLTVPLSATAISKVHCINTHCKTWDVRVASQKDSKGQ